MGCPTTIAMEEACQAYAESIGMACSVLRDKLSTGRRAGKSREELLDLTLSHKSDNLVP